VKDWIFHYLYGLLAAVFNGTVSTAYVSFGASGANAAGWVDLKGITLTGFLSVFVGTILFHAVVYFYNHRVPDNLPDRNGDKTPETFRSVMIASRSPEAAPPKPTPPEPIPTT
jgi:hypothetical protein